MEDGVIVQEFLNYLNFEKRFSEHTAKCYGADLRQFSEFLINYSDREPSEKVTMYPQAAEEVVATA